MVVIILSKDMQLPDIAMQHYDLPPGEARKQFRKDFGYEPKFGFVRLSDPKHTLIVTDLQYTVTSHVPSNN